MRRSARCLEFQKRRWSRLIPYIVAVFDEGEVFRRRVLEQVLEQSAIPSYVNPKRWLICMHENAIWETLCISTIDISDGSIEDECNDQPV